MQVVVDILKILFFPGLLFMAISGSLLLLVEGGVRSLLWGGKNAAFLKVGSHTASGALSLSRLITIIISLLSLGLAALLLIDGKGNIFTLILLLSAVDLIPLAGWIGTSQRRIAYLPVVLRASFIRMMTFFLVGVSVSLRSPDSFLANLDSYRDGGCFEMISRWNGYRYWLVLAALVLSLLALFLFDLGGPIYAFIAEEKVDVAKGISIFLARGAERALTVLAVIIIFLGYPWTGWTGIAAWSGAVFGAAVAMAAIRAAAGGRDRVTIRRWRSIGFLLALVSMAAAVTAAW
ncbi:MAG: hypothetical protein A2W01_01430 [Candidatus Solincola sediminis]|uniref:Uncharacterized protein n=1 Tax=Candidatus Solincola sediminis TaxID=1797199 RepID=A0A1F2WHG4_9ACTN|nr:MAG: hypothetical protein A2Y75_03595 [Candidatus Solincola sediminis]OFW58778.1 MAG: hypothetical protein A2W01_01430 [Candidatus Solincola sediminis]